MIRNSRRTNSQFALVLALILLSPAVVFATNFEISRLATQLNLASAQLANELRYVHGYGSVRSRAQRLSREAGQLIDAIRRNRSHSYLRSQFNDIGRRYNKLEDAFLRANRNHHNPGLFNEVSFISNLYSSLSLEFYYTNYREPRYQQPYYYNPPLVINRRYSVPPAYAGRRFVNSNRRQQNTRRYHNRLDYPPTQALQLNNFGQPGTVLDRQTRQDRGRARVENFSNARTGRTVEARRRNHYQ